jgi:aspartyl-tRNA(Asn)/glutamyl-tRNA(Gln) amidotransferase subunit A
VDQIIDKLAPLTSAMLFVSGELKATDYARVLRAKQELTIKLGKFFQTYDLLLTPTLPSPPLPIDFEDPIGFLKWVNFTFPFNLTGQPAASIPAGWTDDGLPVGLQIVGRPFDEATVLRAAATFEAARPWAHRKPSLG